MLLREAAHAYKWRLNYGGVALMWRGGCIIRRFVLFLFLEDVHLSAGSLLSIIVVSSATLRKPLTRMRPSQIYCWTISSRQQSLTVRYVSCMLIQGEIMHFCVLLSFDLFFSFLFFFFLQESWRKTAAMAVQLGIPTPAFSSALAFYDGYRCVLVVPRVYCRL